MVCCPQPSAALSMSPVMELYSWQEAGEYYNVTLDVEAIGKIRNAPTRSNSPTRR